MRAATRLWLLRIAALVLTLPLWFLLFALAVSLDAGPVVGLLVVFVPLGLLAAGIALLVRGLRAGDRASDGSTERS
ncbi:hypothetical protein L593_04275 [Salinarchaeum sp. Harcht-Bsk1]|uniref:hypothetical protein n=1 Tax=Salinarchaeum sp. Harcht-Bsk1 TaxID=1333523 RepID=UPI0003422ACC|nr:hypothetical protein [Salinarchaeum sp. Harcht-Bsk1]AGN00806.1 hypothetical protein L593_04275 [Salinarchaeum sp. Harcht-Bsk1]